MKKSFRMSIKIAVFALVVSLSGLGVSSLFAQSSVEQRLAALEAKIRQLEGELAIQKAVTRTAIGITGSDQRNDSPLSGAFLRPAVLTESDFPTAVATVSDSAVPMPPPPPAAQTADFTDDFEGLNFFKGVKVGGFIDAYYNWNFNEPGDAKTTIGGTGLIRNFDFNHNSLTFSQADLEITKSVSESAPLGYMVQTVFGPSADWINGIDYAIGNSTAAHFMQYYLSARIPTSRGITLDIGKFVTQHGAEVIDSRSVWNYSRGLLFALAIPYHHTGVRATIPVSDTLTLGASLVNGWNNVIDNNGGKTGGFMLSWNPSPQVGFIQNYMVGPEQSGNSDDIRHLFDSLLTVKLGDKVTWLTNYDYGMDRISGAHVHWSGVATYLRMQATPTIALTPRFEFYSDPMGFTTGTRQFMKEFTLTPEFTISENLVTRFEWRADWSTEPTFTVGDPSDDPSVQNTLGVGLILKF
ncbi:MAG: hypothetical protein A3F68_09520 [Acidobacteria bacterium RIFCSPLOWO2_12_FULL_54_10]|nr:MAG: hypothetical protein A3F68_09520 [Acidobacteria bacterium RIFCSPLOWO2_12_FULL_54_10]